MINHNNEMLKGAMIVDVRKMSAGELDANGWDDNRGFNGSND